MAARRKRKPIGSHGAEIGLGEIGDKCHEICCETHNVVIIAPGKVFVDVESSSEHRGQKEDAHETSGKIDFQVSIVR